MVCRARVALVGTELDYVEDDLDLGFRFSIPNDSSRCGYRGSFTV